MKLIEAKPYLKVGMKVKETRGREKSKCDELWDGKEATITRMDNNVVCFNRCPHSWNDDIDLDINPTPSWENLRVGDEIEAPSGSRAKVVEVGASGKTFLISLWSGFPNWETCAGRWYHIEEAKRDGWKVVAPTPKEEVIEINGKRYKAEDVNERIKELKPLEQ